MCVTYTFMTLYKYVDDDDVSPCPWLLKFVALALKVVALALRQKFVALAFKVVALALIVVSLP